jgi:hypothetical protein
MPLGGILPNQPQESGHPAEDRQGLQTDDAKHPFQHFGFEFCQPQIQVVPGDDGVDIVSEMALAMFCACFVGKPAASSRWASFNVSKATELITANHAQIGLSSRRCGWMRGASRRPAAVYPRLPAP